MKDGHGSQISDAERRALRQIIDRALCAHQETGRTGIAAAVLKDDTVIATAENQVKMQDDPTQHAEIVALECAAKAFGSRDLSGCCLVSTLQPCEMCLSAMRFAGISRLVFAARQQNVARKYFAFPQLGIDDFRRGGPDFSFVGGQYEQDVLHLYVNGAE